LRRARHPGGRARRRPAGLWPFRSRSSPRRWRSSREGCWCSACSGPAGGHRL